LSTIIGVKAAIIDVLKADQTLQSLLTKDANGNWPIYHSLVQQRIHKPCITVEDVADQGEVSGLKDAYDYDVVKRRQWQHAVIQIDCWSGRSAEERDQLQIAVQKCLLNGSNQVTLRSSGIQSIQDPTIVTLDETQRSPGAPLWRKSLRYRVFYFLEE